MDVKPEKKETAHWFAGEGYWPKCESKNTATHLELLGWGCKELLKLSMFWLSLGMEEGQF